MNWQTFSHLAFAFKVTPTCSSWEWCSPRHGARRGVPPRCARCADDLGALGSCEAGSDAAVRCVIAACRLRRLATMPAPAARAYETQKRC